jgi:hypothetical protein
VALNGAIPFFNEFVSPNWVQTPMSNNTYMSVWLVGVPATADSDSQDFRYMWIQGQTAGSLSSQVALFPEDLALGNLAALFTEFVFSAKIILRYTGGNWHIAVVEDLTGTRARTTGSPSGNYLTEVTHDETLTGGGTATSLLSVVFNLFTKLAGFLNYFAVKTSLTPADATTATVDVSTAYDYTITPSGAAFTLALDNIPATGTAWSVTIYAVDWDGVTVTLPAGSVTPGGSGLSFTSGGGKDRLIVRGNSGPSGEKEFYNLPGDMQ